MIVPGKTEQAVGEGPGDHDVRQRALDPERSFIVQAPAGSGKTALLIQRVLSLLATVNAPEEIVAITFTRKAAAEMRERMLAALRSATHPPSGEQNPYQQQTIRLAEAVLRRGQQKKWDLLQQPYRLQFMTIDAFCGLITRRMPLLSGLGERMQPVEHVAHHYQAAARQTLLEVEEYPHNRPIALLLAHLDNQWDTCEKLLAKMLSQRDQWLRHVMQGRSSLDRPALALYLNTSLNAAITERLQRADEVVPRWLRDELPRLAIGAAGQLATSGRNPMSPVLHWQRRMPVWPVATHEELSAWAGLIAMLLTDAGTWRKTITVQNGFPAEQKAEKKRMLSILERLQEETGENRRLREALTDSAAMPPHMAYEENQFVILSALIDVLPRAVAHLQWRFADYGEVDFAEIAMRAAAALGSEDRPTDLVLRLDAEIRHLLVDEFQDTSRSQFQLLTQLTSGWTGEDGRTLFLVGDPMQSIYRFREADVGLFLHVRHRGLGSVCPESLQLQTNFRTQQSLVDWSNKQFAALFPEEENIETGAVPFTPAQAMRPASSGDPVQWHLDCTDEAAEAARIVQIVRDLRAQPDGELQRIAILVRGRVHLQTILPALQQAAIPCQPVEVGSLNHLPVVRDLMALTRALLLPSDRLSWLTILRAPWCGLSLQDLARLVEGTGATVWQRMCNESVVATLSDDGQARLRRILPVLAAARVSRRRQDPFQGVGCCRRWVENTWRALGGEALLDNATDRQNSQTFFDRLQQVEQAGTLLGIRSDLSRFEAEVAGLRAGSQASEAASRLQLMTIHRAKGLEFDVVILPGLHRATRSSSGDRSLLLWHERSHEDGTASLLLAPVKSSESDRESAVYQHIARIRKQQEDQESKRLLYVAVTRAREQVHLLGIPVSGGDTRSFLGMLTSAQATPPAAPVVAVPEGFPAGIPTLVAQPRRLFWRPPATWAPAPPDHDASWQPATASVMTRLDAPPAHEVRAAAAFDWANEVSRHVGTLMHRLLHRMGHQGLEVWTGDHIEAQQELYRHELRQLGVPESGLQQSVQRVMRALLNVIHDRQPHGGRWILSGVHRQVENEYPLRGRCDGMYRQIILDRTFVDESGTRWVIDYKTAEIPRMAARGAGPRLEQFLDREQRRYQPQMVLYMQMMARHDPSHPVRAGLYFPQIPAWRSVAGTHEPTGDGPG